MAPKMTMSGWSPARLPSSYGFFSVVMRRVGRFVEGAGVAPAWFCSCDLLLRGIPEGIHFRQGQVIHVAASSRRLLLNKLKAAGEAIRCQPQGLLRIHFEVTRHVHQ